MIMETDNDGCLAIGLIILALIAIIILVKIL
jgi:hypothetical protein